MDSADVCIADAAVPSAADAVSVWGPVLKNFAVTEFAIGWAAFVLLLMMVFPVVFRKLLRVGDVRWGFFWRCSGSAALGSWCT